MNSFVINENSNDWDSMSTVSNFRDYLSDRIMLRVSECLRKIERESYYHEILFTSDKKVNIKRINNIGKRSVLMKIFNDRYNINIVLELVKYYNKYGFLNSNSQYKFIEKCLACKRKSIIKKLGIKDVNNIRRNKYNHKPFLTTLAIQVRNSHIRKRNMYNGIINECRNIIVGINQNYTNPFLILEVEEGVDETAEEATVIDEHLSPTSSKPIKLRYMSGDTIWTNNVPVYKELSIPIRDISLLAKLRLIIRRFAEARKPKEFREEIEMEFVRSVQPEMMDPEQPTQQQEAGPVVLNAIEQDSVVETTQSCNNDFWTLNSTSDILVDQQHASSMEILAHQFQWSSADKENKLIFDLKLPIQVIANNPNHPAAMLFSQYAYWNGDMKIRIHINTTPFHIGKLIFSWYYASDFDANAHHRNNIASSTLLPHVDFSASQGDDVVLEIPFKNYRSMLCTRRTAATDSKPLYLGNLRCHVFNALVLGESTTVDGYIHVAFLNNQYTGICPRLSIQPEMLPTRTMIKAVEGSLKIIDKTLNMDKPPNPVVPIMYTPQLTDSLATGTNDVNNIHALRLDPLGQTPHPLGSSTTIQETMISNIIQRPGLLKTLKWTTTSSRGYNILKMPVSPELNYNDYYSVNITENGNTYMSVVLPPVSAVSCFNAYNRGSIKYIIEIICSRYHAGALLVSFTPRTKNVDLNMAMQSYNATIDIGNVSKYDFVAPYINERPYNPRFNREGVDILVPQLAPIGEFNIFVLNELRAINDVSKTVYVNLYMSAHSDFEVAIPVPPLYSVNYDYKVAFKPKAYYLDSITDRVGLDSWRYFSGTQRLAVFKYEAPPDGIAQIKGIKPFTVYKLTPRGGQKIQGDKYSVSLWYDDKGSLKTKDVEVTVEYFAMLIVNGDKDAYFYAIPFLDETTAKSYCKVHKSRVTASDPFPNSPDLDYWHSRAPDSSYYFALRTTNEGSYRTPTSHDVTDYPFIEVQMATPEMDTVIVDPTISSLPSAMNGLRLFGEQFTDLKDYCRRYQVYGCHFANPSSNHYGFRLRVPITPIGLELDDTKNGSLHSITREGLIGYIASAYRFYRGSLRFKIMVTTHRQPVSTNANAFDTWYIQHKPDILLNTRSIDCKYFDSLTQSPSDVLQSGYAYTAFSPHLNNSITFEIPCYIPTNLLMLQRPNFAALAETLHYTLGCFDLYGFTNRDAATYQFSIHYAFGDDMHLSTHVGFPPMIPLYSLPTRVDEPFEVVQAEMDDPVLASTSKDVQLQPEGKGIVQGIKDKVSGFVAKATCSSVRSEFGLEPEDDDSIYKLIKDMTIKLGKEYKDLIISVVSQVVHCISNPCISTFVNSIITILAHLGVRCYNYLSKFTNFFTKYFSPVQSEAVDDKTEISTEENMKRSFTKIIVDLGASAYGKTYDFFKDFRMPDFTRGLFANIRMGALTVTACVTMFKNIIDVVPKVWCWIAKYVNPLAWYRWFISDNKDFIRQWISDVEWFTDPNNTETVKSDSRYACHGEMLVIVGRDISIKMNQLDKDKYDHRYVTTLNNKLQQVYQTVVSNYRSISGIGIEPYAFRLVGDSQCGKSYITKELVYEALASIGYKSNANLLYTRPKTRHFDGLTGLEAAIYYDDFLHIKTEEAASEQIAELLTLKSKCLFIPPRADLVDKGKAFNPLILAATMNELYPDFKNICGNSVAWMNRFDDTIQVIFSPPQSYPNAADCTELPFEELQQFNHCRFKIYKYRNNGDKHPNADSEFKQVMVPEISNATIVSDIDKAPKIKTTMLNFAQLKWYISNKFTERMEIISKECVRDLEMIKKFRPETDSSFNVNLEKYVDFIKERNRDLNVQEQTTIDQVKLLRPNKVCSKCSNPMLTCPCKILNVSAMGSLATQPEQDDNRFAQTLNLRVLQDKYNALDASFKNFIDWDILRLLLLSNSTDTVKLQVFNLLESPCIHRYLNVVRSKEYVELDKDKEKFCIISNTYEQYDLDDSNCCNLLETDSEFKNFMYMCFLTHYPASQVPAYLNVVKPSLTRKGTMFYNTVQKQKELFQKILDEEMTNDTWLSHSGSKVLRICKRIAIVLGSVLAIYGLINYKEVYRGLQKLNPYSNRQSFNKQFAKMLEEHTVTAECLEGNCSVCVTPQMAYDEKRVLRRPRQVVLAKDVSPQAEMASDIFNSINVSLKRNYFYIVAEDGITQSIARCLGIQGRWFIAVDHYFDKFSRFSDNTKYYYCDQQIKMNLNFKEIKQSRLVNSALVMCLLPKNFPSFKDITKKFISQEHVLNASPDAILYEPTIPPSDALIGRFDIVLHRNYVELVDDTLAIPDINGEDKYTTCDWYWKYHTSGKGLCGSVLMTDANLTSPLMGIHVAGRPGGGCGYAELVCRETLTMAIAKLDPEIKIVDIEIEGQMFNGDYIKLTHDPKDVKSALDGDFIFTGVVPSKYAYRPPTKSKLEHTICYNQITTSTYDFPHLSHKDPRFVGSPMVSGCTHHTDPPLNFEADILDIVQDDIRSNVLAKVKPVRAQIGVLSVEQSVCGISLLPSYGAMEFDTSEGFPFTSIRPKYAKDKKWLFDLEVCEDGYKLNSIHHTLLEVMAIKQAQRELGIVPLTVFTDCLKDAKLPREKCHKTRIFSISPVDFTIQFRQYFYDFTIAFQEARFNIESAVGINVDSYEWHEMVVKLLSNSTKFVCGDYSKFGPRLMSSAVIRFFEIICDWYEEYGDIDPINRKIRMIMAHEIAFAQHLMLNMVYQVLCGAPSGCPITTILNNGVNMTYLRSAFLVLVRELGYDLSLSDYPRYISNIFYGDDLIMTVKDEILSWFNATTLSEFFSRYDIKFTDALKTGDMQLYTTVFSPETSFLKRNIKRHNSRPVFTAAMDQRAIEETCNWTFKSNNLKESSLISCESMLLNAHGHGPNYYENLRQKVFKFWRQYHTLPLIPNWKDVDYRIYEGITIIRRNADMEIVCS